MKERFCGRCGGRGTVVKQYDDYGISDPKDVSCPSCGGCGKVVSLTDAHALEQRAEQAEAERDNLQRRMAAVEAYWLADPGKWGNNERWQAADAAIRDVPRA